jgi:TIR domain
MPRIFISYRRDDSASDADRLDDALSAALGKRSVFLDIQSIRAGDNFKSALDAALSQTDLTLVLIGKTWLEELRRRADEGVDDFVKLEIERSLGRAGRPVMPLLLHGTDLPSADELPDSLRQLVERQALTLNRLSWAEDIKRLVDEIGRPYRWGALTLRASLFLIVVLVIAPWQMGIKPEEALYRIGLPCALLTYGVVEYLAHRWLSRRR